MNEYAFEMAASGLRFGYGATREVGADLIDLGAKRALVFTDPVLRHLAPVATVLESLEVNGVEFTIFDRVRVEPSDASMQEAIAAANAAEFDAIVAVGGGSTIDTAKVANLYSAWPAEFLDYVNPPIGRGKPVPGPLKPLIAIPTTAGTGSETTGVAIFDYKPLRAKTGIAHRRLKPTLGIVDPENTRTLPAAVAASGRTRCAQPRDRIVYGNPVRRKAAARASHSAPGISRLESDQRHLEHGGPAHDGEVSAARRGRSVG